MATWLSRCLKDIGAGFGELAAGTAAGIGCGILVDAIAVGEFGIKRLHALLG